MKVNVTLLAVWVVLWNGCKPDYDAPCRDQAVKIKNDFTSEQKASIPYGTADTLVFVSAGMDTLRMFTQSYQSAYTFLPSVIIGNPECPPDVDGYQLIQTALFDSAAGFGIGGFWSKQTDSCRYKIAGRNFDLLISQIGDSSLITYSDSVVINEKTFFAVSKVYGLGGDSILLTKDEGIVYFIDGGKPYRLVSFKR